MTNWLVGAWLVAGASAEDGPKDAPNDTPNDTPKDAPEVAPEGPHVPRVFAEVTNLAEVVEYLAAHHDKSFRVPSSEALRAIRVQVVGVEGPLTKDDEWSAAVSMFEANGFALEVADRVVRVVPAR
ncbi:MAG: hypothetical protein ABMB14_11160 [Myxococcota bacterium]